MSTVSYSLLSLKPIRLSVISSVIHFLNKHYWFAKWPHVEQRHNVEGQMVQRTILETEDMSMEDKDLCSDGAYSQNK